MSDEISVLLVDDHALVRKGFRRMIEDDPGITVVGEAGSGLEAVQLAAAAQAAGHRDGYGHARDGRRPGDARDSQAHAEDRHRDPQHVLAGELRAKRVRGRRARLHPQERDRRGPRRAIRDVAAGKRVLDPGLIAAEREPDRQLSTA